MKKYEGARGWRTKRVRFDISKAIFRYIEVRYSDILKFDIPIYRSSILRYIRYYDISKFDISILPSIKKNGIYDIYPNTALSPSGIKGPSRSRPLPSRPSLRCFSEAFPRSLFALHPHLEAFQVSRKLSRRRVRYRNRLI